MAVARRPTEAGSQRRMVNHRPVPLIKATLRAARNRSPERLGEASGVKSWGMVGRARRKARAVVRAKITSKSGASQLRSRQARAHSTFSSKRPKAHPASRISGKAMCTVSQGMRSPAKENIAREERLQKPRKSTPGNDCGAGGALGSDGVGAAWKASTLYSGGGGGSPARGAAGLREEGRGG